jgi:hemerythrin-like domain-containing protein
MPHAQQGGGSAFAEGGTELALHGYPEDTNAAPAAFHSNLSGEYAMPSRRKNQDQSIDEQPVDEPSIDEQSMDEPSVDAIAMLKEDHQRVKDLFTQYEATSKPATKRTLAAQVFVELETHAQLEENIFYPSVNEETAEGPELVKESLQEHETVKQLIVALRQMGPQSAEFDAKFHELIQNVKHHVEEEENDMFPLAEAQLAEDLEELGEEMQALKKAILAS